MTKKIVLNSEAADQITVSNLKECRDYMKKELKQWKKNLKSDSNPNGYWLHSEDVAYNIRTIEAMNVVLSHFGTE